MPWKRRRCICTSNVKHTSILSFGNEFEMKEELTSMKEALQKLEAKINGHYST